MHSCARVCTPTVSEYIFNPLSSTWQLPSSPAGRYRPPSPTGKGSKREIRAGAWRTPQKKGWGEGKLGRPRSAACQRNGSQQPPDHCWLHKRGPRAQGRAPPLLAFLRAPVASRALRDPPHSPPWGWKGQEGWGRAGRRSRASEPSSCSTASNSNHPDPSVNSNLLTLTAPDKGGLTDLNLHGGLAFPPSLPWSPYPSLQVAPHLAIRAKCQHPSLPEVPAGLPQSTLCAHLRWRQACGHLTGVFPGLG